MAKRDRNKRAARKARQQERERVAVAQAAAGSNEKSDGKSLFKKSDASGKSSRNVSVAKADRKGIAKVTGYFSDVRTEMHQVTWPTRLELRNYSLAVIATLIVFGVAIWLVDTGFVAGLVQYTGLRG